jgi:hypothetical protein
MQSPDVVFIHTGLTVHAAAVDEQERRHFRGELLDQDGTLQDAFAYTREAYPGAVIGALKFTDLSFAVALAARMWLHTEAANDR